MIFDIVDCLAIFSCNDVSEITNMSNLISGTGVGLSMRVVMRASGDTSVGEVSPLMNVESVKSWGKTRELSMNVDLLSFDLSELDSTSDTGGAVKNDDCVVGSCGFDHFLLYLVIFVYLFLHIF